MFPWDLAEMGETQEGMGDICGMNAQNTFLGHLTIKYGNCKNTTQVHGNFSRIIFSFEKTIKQIVFHQTE